MNFFIVAFVTILSILVVAEIGSDKIFKQVYPYLKPVIVFFNCFCWNNYPWQEH